MTAPSAELLAQAVAPRGTGVWFWLFAVELNTDDTESRWVLVTSHSEAVTFDGEVYNPWRVKLPRIDSGGPGDLGGSQVEISNAGGVAAEYIRQFEGLQGRRLVVRLVNSLHLDAATHSLPHTYEIADSRVDHGAAVLTLGKLPLHEVSCPSRRFARIVCGVRFGGLMCGWAVSKGGDATACDRSLDGPNGCVAHNNQARFGGQPGMPGTR